jgi:cell division protein FtsL
MTGDNFEYAIKKDVRNNPIVREVDRERHREMWRTMLIGLFVATVLVFTVWREMSLFSHGYSVDEYREKIAESEADNEELQLEVEQLEAPARIEEKARLLGMIEPNPPPPGSVVALR